MTHLCFLDQLEYLVNSMHSMEDAMAKATSDIADLKTRSDAAGPKVIGSCQFKQETEKGDYISQLDMLQNY